MNKETEMKLYKALGVEYFRKGAFALEKFIHKRDNRKNRNYHIENTTNSESTDKFRKFFYYNGNIHVRNLIKGGLLLTGLILFNITPFVTIPLTLLLLKDTYCVMLQRYNWLRVSIYEEKLKKRENKKVLSIKEKCYDENILKNVKEKEELLKNIKALRMYLVNNYVEVDTVNSNIKYMSSLLNLEEDTSLKRGKK